MDLAYGAAADVMLLVIDEGEFGDPELPSRLRFVSRNAFPILGIAPRNLPTRREWLRGGLHAILAREDLHPNELDRTLRHWVRYRRMQRRLYAADRRALQWWKDLIEALDEVRGRLERGTDSIDAFVGLLDGPAELPAARRRRYLDQVRSHLAEMSQIATDLDVAARTIQLKGLERSERNARTHRPALSPEDWLTGIVLEEGEERAANASGDPVDDPAADDSQEGHRRFGS